jgi:hypothetical protein
MRMSPVDDLSYHITEVSHELNATASQKRLTFKIRARLRRSSSVSTLISSKLSSLRPSASGILRGNVDGGGKGTCCVRLRSLVLVRDTHVPSAPPPPPPSPPSVLSRDGLVAVAAKGTLNTAASCWDEGMSDDGMGPTSEGRSGGSGRSSCCCQRGGRDCCCGWYCSCCCWWYCNWCCCC